MRGRLKIGSNVHPDDFRLGTMQNLLSMKASKASGIKRGDTQLSGKKYSKTTKIINLVDNLIKFRVLEISFGCPLLYITEDIKGK